MLLLLLPAELLSELSMYVLFGNTNHVIWHLRTRRHTQQMEKEKYVNLYIIIFFFLLQKGNMKKDVNYNSIHEST